MDRSMAVGAGDESLVPMERLGDTYQRWVVGGWVDGGSGAHLLPAVGSIGSGGGCLQRARSFGLNEGGACTAHPAVPSGRRWSTVTWEGMHEPPTPSLSHPPPHWRTFPSAAARLAANTRVGGAIKAGAQLVDSTATQVRAAGWRYEEVCAAWPPPLPAGLPFCRCATHATKRPALPPTRTRQCIHTHIHRWCGSCGSTRLAACWLLPTSWVCISSSTSCSTGA